MTPTNSGLCIDHKDNNQCLMMTTKHGYQCLANHSHYCV